MGGAEALGLLELPVVEVDGDDLGRAGDRAPWMEVMPTPPQPNTTTDEPGVTLAVLMAAPTPVMTPQPTRPPISSGMSSSILTTPWCGMIVSSANVPAPAMPNTALPSRVNCGVPPITIWMLEHRLGCLSATQYLHSPHGRGPRDDHVIADPTSVTPSPTSATMPAPSWPRTAGAGCGIVPFMRGQVGVAHAGGLDLDLDLAGPDADELDVVADLEGVVAGVAQHRSAHGVPPGWLERA